jgi:hypothetical protein
MRCRIFGHQWQRLPTPIVGGPWWQCRRCGKTTDQRPGERRDTWWRVWQPDR